MTLWGLAWDNFPQQEALPMVQWGPLLAKGWYRTQVPLHGPVTSPSSPLPGDKPQFSGHLFLFLWFLIAVPPALGLDVVVEQALML